MQNEIKRYIEEVKELKDNGFIITENDERILDIINTVFLKGEITIKEIKKEIATDDIIEIFKSAVLSGKPLLLYCRENMPDILYSKLDEYIEDNLYLRDGSKWTLLKRPENFYLIFCLFVRNIKEIEERIEILSAKFDSRLLNRKSM